MTKATWLMGLGFLLLVVPNAGADDDFMKLPGEKKAPSARTSSAPKMSKAQRRVQALRLQKCYDYGYRRFFACRSKGRMLCNMKADIYTRVCIKKSSIAWFCGGFRQTHTACKSMCQKGAVVKWKTKLKRRYKRSWKRKVKKRFASWSRRSLFACARLCTTLKKTCNIRSLFK